MNAERLREALTLLVEQREYLDPVEHKVEAARRSSWAWVCNKKAVEILRALLETTEEESK